MHDNSTSSVETLDGLPSSSAQVVSQEEVAEFLRRHIPTFKYLWCTHFNILDDAALMPHAANVSVQVVRGASYRNDCKYSQFEDYRYFCYTLSGVGGYSDTNGEHLIPPGRSFLVEKDNADASYYYPAGETEPWRFLAFNFNGLPAHAMARSVIRKYGPVFDLPSDAPIIKRLLSHESTGHTIVNIHALDASQLVMELLFALMAAAQSREEADPTVDLVRRAIPLMSTDDDVSVQSVALQLGVSREHLSRCFQSRLGISPRQFCLRHRMRNACLMLKNTSTPIRIIAESIGYADYTNFAHAFRQVTNMTPTQFRRSGSVPFAGFITGGPTGR